MVYLLRHGNRDDMEPFKGQAPATATGRKRQQMETIGSEPGKDRADAAGKSWDKRGVLEASLYFKSGQIQWPAQSMQVTRLFRC